LLEVYTGAARASQQVLKLGGRAIRLGLEWGQNFRRQRDRRLAAFLLYSVFVAHLWSSFPCTAFGCWVSINLARHCDLGPTRKSGMIFLRHTVWLVRVQQALDGMTVECPKHQTTGRRRSHLENPLPSQAWRTPPMRAAIADMGHATLHQCRVGARGPLGGPVKKATAIKTDDPQMRAAMDLRCQCGTTHEHLEGAATKRSETYTHDLARRIASVILKGGENDRCGSCWPYGSCGS
jgi:hypothetical protein